MMIISFSWTSNSFKAGQKSVTRRTWTPDYAKRFKVGDICKAYDKQPRFGGRQIGLLKIKSLAFEDIKTMPDEDYFFEGFQFMMSQGLKIWDKSPREAFDEWRNDGGWYWVLRFEKIEEAK